MQEKEISMQLFTTRHFQPYDPILKFLSNYVGSLVLR